jgi:hypothetical protein
MKRFLSFCILLILIASTLSSQTTSSDKQPLIIRTLQQYESGKGQVQIVQDKKIDDLITRYIDNNPHKKTIPGYRIWIFSDGKQGSRNRMLEAKAKFMTSFPDIEPYPEYIAPYYKIYVGDFRTLPDAFRMKKQIESLFPNAFIVSQNIDYSKLK